MAFVPGPLNLLTDVAGLRVGNADDAVLKSGTTVVLCDTPATASCLVLGGAPGTRETDLLEPHNLVETINGVVLSGGSAYGLDSVSGVQGFLREHRIGFEVAGQIVPIVPGAILFDLVNGGRKEWDRYPPYRELGYAAAASAATDFALGTAGAGAGATVSGLKGGLGSASVRLPNGTTVAALVAVNAVGSVTIGKSPHFWAAPLEIDAEFGGVGFPSPLPSDANDVVPKHHALQAGANTTIAVIATDAKLTKAACKRLSIAAHDGFARAIWPAHTPIDGDLVFSLATGGVDRDPSLDDIIDLQAAATVAMARAIARGIHAAVPAENDIFPTWSMRAGRA